MTGSHFIGLSKRSIFLNRRLEEFNFELTKTSIGQDYMSTNEHKTKTRDTNYRYKHKL
jgi:hypothetical protein